jgi:hypothetical protein
MRHNLPYALASLLLLATACKRERLRPCPDDATLLTEYTVDGTTARIYDNGKAYEYKRGECRFVVDYFDPDFFNQHYVLNGGQVWIRTDEGDLVAVHNAFVERFDRYATFTDIIAKSIADTALNWTGFTLQSPQAPEISDYVALRQCILAGTCDFKDNRLALSPSPTDANDTVLRCDAVAPGRGMVTSKCSFESNFPYFPGGTDIWFEASYYFASGLPYSIADFENSYFESSPGPRIVLDGGALAIENKFGAKEKFRQSSPRALPLDQWVTVKLHIALAADANGRFELWQDGVLLLDVRAQTLPLSNSIQNSFELGISATDEACVLFIDDIRVSDTPF